MELEDVHNCEKCRGKTVLIGLNKDGSTICGYCGAAVDYSEYFLEVLMRGKDGP